MPKFESTRFQETLTFIQQAPDLTPGVRHQIVALVNAQFPRLTPADRQAFSQLSSAMSVKAHIAPGVAAGTEAERDKRRAVFLLWMAIGKAQGIMLHTHATAAQAMNMAPAALQAAFSDVMLKAAVVASAAGAQWVFGEFTAHPVRFLTRHRIMIPGTGAGSDRFSVAPDGNYQNVLTFYFRYNANIDRFEIGAVPDATMGAAHPVTTVSVPAVHWSQVPGAGAAPCNFAGILGCELTGATFMVTTQFTGCAFNWTTHGGVLRASHVSPAGGGPGAYPGGGHALAQRLMANGAHANAGNTAATVFGAGAGNAPPIAGGASFYPDPTVVPFRWASIFGLIKGGTWRFYLQVIGPQPLNEIRQARRIL